MKEEARRTKDEVSRGLLPLHEELAGGEEQSGSVRVPYRNRLIRTFSFLLLTSSFFLPPVEAQQFRQFGQPQHLEKADSGHVKRTSDRIVSRREFRHFNRFGRRGGVRSGMGPSGQGQFPMGDGAGPDARDRQQGEQGNDWRGNDWEGEENNRRDRNPRDWQDWEDERNRPNRQPRDWNDRDWENDPPPRRRRNRDWDEADSSPASSSSSSGGGGFGSSLGAMAQVLAWVFLSIVCGLIVMLVVQAFVNRQRDESLEENAEKGTLNESGGQLQPETAPGELPADVYVSQAQKLAQQGQYREAIAQLILGAMSKLERSGMIKYRQGLTHRDYVRAARKNPECSEGMRSLVRTYEPIAFGRREATPSHFEQSLVAYENGFHAVGNASKRNRGDRP